MPIAFFDLDRTAVEVNSATLWVRRQHREGRIGLRLLAEAGLWLGLYRLGLMRVDKALRKAVASLEGQVEAELERRTQQFWDEEVAQRVRPGARRTLAWHREQGHAVVLLTSSSPYISRCAVRTLQLDDYVCTEAEVVDGVFTGRILGTPAYGQGKLTRLREYLAARGEDETECWFYTDSTADQPVLEAVGHPVCVAPDPPLAREARRRGWPVEDWDRAD